MKRYLYVLFPFWSSTFYTKHNKGKILFHSVGLSSYLLDNVLTHMVSQPSEETAPGRNTITIVDLHLMVMVGKNLIDVSSEISIPQK